MEVHITQVSLKDIQEVKMEMKQIKTLRWQFVPMVAIDNYINYKKYSLHSRKLDRPTYVEYVFFSSQNRLIYNTKGKSLTHGPKRHKDNQTQSLKPLQNTLVGNENSIQGFSIATSSIWYF